LGISLWAVVIPLVGLVVKTSPAEKGLLPDGEKEANITPEKTRHGDHKKHELNAAANSGLTLTKALQTPTYWMIAISFIFVPAGAFGTMAHQTSYIESIGISREAASAALGFTAGMGIVGKLFFGFLAERIRVKYVAMICFSLQAVGLLVLMGTQSMALLYVFVLVFGFAMGGMAVLQPLIVMSFFGTTAVGAILGSISFLFALGAASGTIYAAYIYDFFQSYHWAFLTNVAIYLCAATIICLTPVAKKR
jgi:sugar phosphate permease